MNQDEAEIKKFSKLAEHWWDRKGPLRTLHDINPARVSFIEQHCSITPDTQVLDVGCGAGILTEHLALQSTRVSGIDLSHEAIEVAKIHSQDKGLNIHYQVSSVENMAKTHQERFDVITCMELLEHVPDPASIIKSCAVLLKPGGHIFVSTINRTASAFFQAILVAEYSLKLLPINTHHYEKFIQPAELSLWFRRSGLTMNRSLGIKYKPWTRTAQLIPGLKVNYLVHGIKLS